MLEALRSLFDQVCELDRTFVDRINANKAARGEAPTKLRKAKREEITQYEKDAVELDQNLTHDFAKISAESIVSALKSGLETEITFWETHVLKHSHPSDRPIIEESLTAKKLLHHNLEQFLNICHSKVPQFRQQ